jgi:N-acetylmuramoyl-L-alanine amidase
MLTNCLGNLKASISPLPPMRQSLCQPYFWLIISGLVLFGGQPAVASPLEQPIAQSVGVKPDLGQPSLDEETTPLPDQKNEPVERPVLVMIDPGHGGKDPGAIGMGELREVDVILPIALQVAEILKKNGIAIQLTRDRDYFVGLDERVQMSLQAGATIFVSIHANSIDNRPDVNGLETYYYGLGEELANVVHQKIIDVFNTDLQIPLNDRRVRSARFLVLRKSEIPAILLETGYLSSPTESLQLGKPEYQAQLAKAIAQGILKYLHQGSYADQPVPRS